MTTKIDEMSKQELVALATEHGVNVRPSWNTAKIRAAILEAAKDDKPGGDGQPVPFAADGATQLDDVTAPPDAGEPEPEPDVVDLAKSGAEPTPRDRAVDLGIMIPPNWTDDQVLAAIKAHEQALSDAETRPPARAGWTPGSPRG